MYYRDFGEDRRKNAARRKAAVTYDVSWDEAHQAFGVYRNGRQTDLSSTDEAQAIELAIGQALRDHGLGLAALVFSMRQGTRNVEWPKPKPVSP